MNVSNYLRRQISKLSLTAALVLISASSLSTGANAASNNGNRWYQIEISVFSNEIPADRNEELWSPQRLRLTLPNRIRRLVEPLDFLNIENFDEKVLGNISLDQTRSSAQRSAIDASVVSNSIASPAIGPFPKITGATFKLPDYDRDAYLQLPDAEGDFQQSNRALRRSANQRLLFYSVWRQPILSQGAATAIYIEGGESIDGQSELQGSVTLRFNDNQDRVVIDANLWLGEYSGLARSSLNWQFPDLPEQLTKPAQQDTQNSSLYSLQRIYQLRQSRAMRSNEFHYLDHPALGIIVSVKPYTRPDLVSPDTAGFGF